MHEICKTFNLMLETTYFVVGVCSVFELLRKDLSSFVNSLFSPDPKSFLKKSKFECKNCSKE